VQRIRAEVAASTLKQTDPDAYRRRVFEAAVAPWFFDPSLAGHQFYTDSITVPVTIVHNILYTDAKVTAFTSSGMEFGHTVAMDDGIKATVSMTITGLPTFPT
jgi:hypothetical protein